MGKRLKQDQIAAQNRSAQSLFPIHLRKADVPSDMELS
jgi:hypothetical protein